MECFDCRTPSWEELEENIREIARKIEKDGFRPDIVIALSRGGLVPARIICDSMIIKDLVSIKVDHWGITATRDGKAHLRYPLKADLSGKNVLIVDDITDTGESMTLAKEFVEKLNPKKVKTAAIFHIKTSKVVPDYYAREIDWVWVIWPWNYCEDLANIISKILTANGSSTTADIEHNLKEKFNIKISTERLKRLMNELQERGSVTKDSQSWKLC